MAEIDVVTTPIIQLHDMLVESGFDGEPESTFAVDNLVADVYNLGISNLSLGSLPSEWLLSEEASLAALSMLSAMSNEDIAKMHSEWMSRQVGSGEDKPAKPYTERDKVAYIGVSGMMQKQLSCMSMLFGGGTSTVRTRSALRTAARDIKSGELTDAVIVWDTGGGYVDGSFDLAEDIRRMNDYTGGHIWSYVEDNCCSAGILGASQAQNVFGNMNCITGSVGVVSRLVDTSEANKLRGIKYHVIKTGARKGIGMGDSVSLEDISYMQDRADKVMGLFVRMVQSARGLTPDQVANVSDASVYIGKEGIKAGLLDGIKSLDQLHNELKSGKTPAGSRKVNKMAANKEDVARWLANDDEELENMSEMTDLTPATPVAEPQTVPAHVQDNSPAMQQTMEQLLTAANAPTMNFDELVRLAQVGQDAVAKTRSNVHKLAVVALGADGYQNVKHMIDNIDASQLNTYVTSFTQMGIAKGLLNENGTPSARVTDAEPGNTTPPAEQAVIEAAKSLVTAIPNLYSL